MTAHPAITEMPQHERPLSELFRLSANAWVEADAKARELEGLKDLLLEQRKNALVLAAQQRGDKLADNAAEREVKASDAWLDYITGMIHARTEANRHKVEMERIRMREREIADHNATIRAEYRLTR